MVYLRARQYDPDLGRFVSADPVLGSLSAPQTQNLYPYVANNPLGYTDPTGHCATLCTAAIGAVAGFFIGGIGCLIAGGADCWQAALAGAGVGFLAGLTFGASLYAAGALGAGTAAAGGGFTFGGIGAVGATVFAGATSGAVGGLGGYVADSVITGTPMTPQGAARATLIGLIVGGATAGLSYGIGRGFGLIPVKFTWGGGLLVNPAVARRPVPATPEGMSRSQFGKLMNWGTSSEAARSQIQNLNPKVRAFYLRQGVTPQMAEEWMMFYQNEALRVPTNPSAAGRAELMEAVWKLLWGRSP